MDFNIIIQYGECYFFSCRCNYPYRKLINFLYIYDYSFRKRIVMLCTCLHGNTILGSLLYMKRSCDYPISGDIFDYHCSNLVTRN